MEVEEGHGGRAEGRVDEVGCTPLDTHLELRRRRSIVRPVGRHHEVEVEECHGGRAKGRVDEVGWIPLVVVGTPIRAQAWGLTHVHECPHGHLDAISQRVLQHNDNI